MHLWIPATVQCDDKQHNSKAEHPLFAISFFGEWLKEVAEESCETNIFVALRIRSDGPRPTDRCLFVTVQLEEDRSQIKCDSASPVNLIVSSTFIHHYRINLKEQHELKVIQPTVLDKIVLGAKTREVYLWLNEKNWMTEFLVKVCQQKVLSRRGDVFLAPLPFTKHLNLNQMINHVFDILTLDCHPVAQGIISVKTEIIVNDLSIDKVSDDISELKHTVKLHSFENYLSLLQYMYSSTFLRHVPRKRLYNSMISVYIASASKLMLPPIMNRFRIRILTKSPFLNCRNAKIDCIDPFNVVFISEWVSKRLQLQDKCWVKLALHPNCNSSDTVSKTRLAQVCILNFENLRKLDHHLFHNLDDTVYLSPHIMFNMVSKPSSIDYHDAKISIEKVKFSCQNRCCRKKEKKCLSFARETHLSLVCSPGNETSDSYTNLLNKYFDTPRYLQTGDVICISTSDEEDFTSEESLKPQQEIIFFQTISVESICKENKFGSLVQKGESTLFLNEDCQSYIPVSIDIFLGLKDLHPIWCSPAPLGMTNYIKRLESLIVPYMNFKNIRKCLGSSILITGPSGCGKSTVIQAACRRLNMHFLETDCHDIVGDKSQTTITRITQVIKKACRCVPCALVFKNVHLLCRHRDGSDEDPRVASAFKEIICENLKSQSEYPLTVIGTTNEKTNVTDDFHEIFLHQITIKPPDEAERKDILFGLLSTINCASDVSIQYWAQQTAGFLLGDFAALIKNASHRAYNKRLTSHPLISFYDAEDLYLSGVFIENEDLKDVLNEMQAAHSDVIGAPKVPDTNWQDIGGLEDVKEAILETIQLPLQHPELFSSEIRRSGVLLFGPPGTGKTLLAKAVATECNLHFLSVKGPELLNMYVGQSEQNVRTVFLRARSASPCVIFFDELDSLAPNRGRSGDSGGVMDRVVSQLLAELDGLDKTGNVFVIGATNRPDLIDPALLRPGRFDKLLFVGIGEDWTSKLKVLEALTMKFSLDPELKLAEVAKRCPPNLTGADLYALCTDAMMNTLSRRIENIQKGTGKQEDPVTVTLEDFDQALEVLVPSISLKELQHYQQLKNSLVS